MINHLMANKKITKYQLSKLSQVPYTTISDICSGKTKLEKCSSETVYKIAKALHVTMEALIEPALEKRCSFSLFKSQTCHEIKEKGDIEFLIDILSSDKIQEYYNKKWYAECLYLLAMVDYLSRINNIPQCNKYDELRKLKLKTPLYPTSILLTAALAEDGDAVKQDALKHAIPEFLTFNIIESEIRNIA